MGSHYEAISLSGVDWLQPREEIGEETVPGGQYAIAFSTGDGMAYGVGTVEQIAEFGRQVRVAVHQIQETHAGPLTHADFEFDNEDNMFMCPRCEVGIEPGDDHNLAATIQRIDAHIASHRPGHERE